MKTRCSYCGPSALALAAQYGIRPGQVIPGREARGGVVCRCLCCGRIWLSKARWTKTNTRQTRQEGIRRGI